MILNKTAELEKTPQAIQSLNSSLQKLELKPPETFEEMEERLLKQVDEEVADAKLVLDLDKKEKDSNK